ncbi:MAG: CDP-diacylglycerol--glycerol-3-phosphate 3-phosphatidyltransferase, partial [Coprobacillaceae bacterium]
YMFPYDMLNIEIPVYHVLNTDISLTNIVVLLIFAIASITDYFDGRIARKEKMITTFGKFADPIADKLLVNTILLLLASDQTISIIIPIIMIGRDTIVDAIRLVAANKQVVIAASPLGKLKTVTQMVAVVMLLLCNFPFSYFGIPIDQIAIWAAAIISVVSGTDYFIKNKKILTESM